MTSLSAQRWLAEHEKELSLMMEKSEKSALDKQVGGSHYKGYFIQPIEFIEKNGLGFAVGNIIKYACRFENKGGREYLEKVIHYAELLIDIKYGTKKEGS